MLSLCMDSAYKNLIIGLYDENGLIDGIAFEAFKKQSETIFVELERLLKKNDLDYKDFDQIVITKGPGSYTGIRIAMTIAKVLSTQMGQTLKTISTMQLYAGKEEKANVILDARSSRVYAAYLENGKLIEGPKIITLDQGESFLKAHPAPVFGDAYLIGQQGQSSDYLKNFGDLLLDAQRVENKHTLTPEYLKSSEAYKA
ncbi:tRNA (adenosine(37)-N6)-threonylcarbamoyltransferase complex dimerization subunit type 1 TsaB [Dubosiella newyorkensis]|uniref:tRNA (Adenosine(37)-N6)-threonylcarbamoyltransferase complex dimerization subunit type 1 TsaB n=1 Tax=Dubosiella newyorkensis TaxID=1862672 RepID=A0A1U7NP50_9FIRM|nr:tRNA (adenosine(37)-N6)-threonylcarbamoyltransferase complex dimerization subunit type 1 TsaB [Dubosiella newyorkensis]OLU47262.1 tRNA (adenosine(37)-N6)-threonylcarbamoyltransferase complex dimerization subunit type 1 TsaB [Dubosiella newyorkensis]